MEDQSQRYAHLLLCAVENGWMQAGSPGGWKQAGSPGQLSRATFVPVLDVMNLRTAVGLFRILSDSHLQRIPWNGGSAYLSQVRL